MVFVMTSVVWDSAGQSETDGGHLVTVTTAVVYTVDVPYSVLPEASDCWDVLDSTTGFVTVTVVGDGPQFVQTVTEVVCGTV